MNIRSLIRAFLTVSALGSALSAHANLLLNGGFETGNFTNWTYTSADGFSFVGKEFASEGIYSAFFGDYQADGGGSISQSIATVVGQKYTFSFDFAGDGDMPSAFMAMFGGTTVFNTTNPAFGPNYVSLSYTVTATSTSTRVMFAAYDDPGYLNLDNVNVTAQAVPEPASVAVLGLGALALVRRRKT